MITLITGKKGAGKTKKLIDLTNQAISKSNGNVVVIEKGSKLIYDISHKARLIDTERYNVEGFEALYGFVCGICATNYDVTDILIDSTLKIGGRDMNAFGEFVNRVSTMAAEADTKITISVSADEDEIPEGINSVCEKA